ncbi:MAG TPA: Y-family DNA polymerase [Flavisolibacter sp.]|nr:Y-family DNA polymerase [Flavisolibacter sp.]
MYAIVDCNSFYCSCECVFKPHLDEKPVVVLSNNDGCIISRSDEAKALGVEMAGPYFKAKHLIEKNNVGLFSSNYNLYGDMSRRVMDTLRSLAGDRNVEVYSVDEAFVSLYFVPQNSLRTFALELRETVERWTGIKVSVGIAPTKTLAKLANGIAKNNKAQTACVAILETEEKIRRALMITKVGDLWGVGRRSETKLCDLGITTAWHLRQMPEEWARKNLGGVVGVRLIKELRGEEAILMDTYEDKKMIATTRMFGNPVTELRDIKEAIAAYTSRAAEKLRRQTSAAGMINVFVVTNEKEEAAGTHFRHGPTYSTHTILPYPTSQTNELIKPALALAESLYREGKMYKKAGVILSGIVPDDSIQGNLFEGQKSIGRFLMEQIDNINFSMRSDVVKFASSGTRRDWKMRKDFQSPRYTTRWEELYEVK